MADKKITDLTSLASADAADVLSIVDVSASTTKKVAVSGLAAAIAANLAASSIQNATLVAAGCDLTPSTSQNISNSVLFPVLFDTEGWDVGGYHSTSSNTSRITIPTGAGGKYQFKANVAFSANSSGGRLAWFVVNGVTAQRYGVSAMPAAPGGLESAVCIAADFNLVAGDYVEVYAYQTSGSTLTIQGNAQAVGDTKFSCLRIGS